MLTYIMRLICVVSVFVMTPVVLVWAGLEKPIQLSDIPQAILKAAQEKFPDAIYKSSNTEFEEEGTFVYEIQGTLKDGRQFEYDVYPTGDIQEIEVEFPDYMVPGAVLKAIQRQMPGFRPTYIEASHSASMKVVGYEFVGLYSGETIDINVSADGNTIEISDK